MHLRRALAMISVALLWTQAYGQKPVDADGVWITAGMGQTDSPRCMNLNASYCYAKEKTCLRYAIDYSSTFSFGEPLHSLVGINGSIGRRFYRKYFFTAQYFGISITKATDREYYRSIKTKVSPGICANSQIYVKPIAILIPEVGVGLEVFGDLNFAQSFVGIRASILFHNTI